MLNRATIIGRLGQDPRLHRGPSKAMARFTVATDVPGRDDPDWHRVVAFEKLAEVCARVLAKGRLVYVEGPMRTSVWTDEHGVERRTTEIIAHRVQFLDRPPARDDAEAERDPRTHGPGGHRRAFEGGQRR